MDQQTWSINQIMKKMFQKEYDINEDNFDSFGKKYTILPMSKKQEILSVMQFNSSFETLSLLSFQYQTSVKNLRRWLSEGIERKPGCGRKKLNLEAEKQLCSWIIEQSLIQGRRVRRNQLKDQAIKLFNDKYFKASKAWQDEFIRNYDIKYQVNEALFNKGMLNALQKQKFQEMKDKRMRIYISEDTYSKEEEEQYDIFNDINETSEKLEKLENIDSILFGAEDFNLKFEESNINSDQYLFSNMQYNQDDAWDFKLNDQESQLSQTGALGQTKNKKKQKVPRIY